MAQRSSEIIQTGIPECTIRPAGPDDVELILKFIRAIAAYEKLSHEVTATCETLRESLFGSRPAAEVVFGQWGGVEVAYAVYFSNFSTFLGRAGIYLEDVFVDPDYRGRGIGKLLLAYVAGIAAARGCHRMEWTVLDWNTPAIDFYRSIDATGMEEWTTQRLVEPAISRLASQLHNPQKSGPG